MGNQYDMISKYYDRNKGDPVRFDLAAPLKAQARKLYLDVPGPDCTYQVVYRYISDKYVVKGGGRFSFFFTRYRKAQLTTARSRWYLLAEAFRVLSPTGQARKVEKGGNMTD
jgi:hypothetical protein